MIYQHKEYTMERQSLMNETAKTEALLMQQSLDSFDYIRSFQIFYIKNRFQSIDHFCKDYFLLQPFWIRIFGFRFLSKYSLLRSIEASHFQIGTTIGERIIVNRDENEIVFGNSTMFLDYRLSMIFNNAQTITVSRGIRLKKPMVKPLYWSFNSINEMFLKKKLQVVL